MRLPPALKGFLVLSAMLAALCLGTEAVCHWVLHWRDPYDFPGFRVYYEPGHTPFYFCDFHSFFDKFRLLHSRDFYLYKRALPYPAPAVAAYALFMFPMPTPHHGGPTLLRFEGSLLLVSWVMLWWWRKALVARGINGVAASGMVLGTYLLSYAFWFEFMQGNIEWVVWAILSLGIWAFCTGRFKTAAVCIGVAGSMKLFPIIFIGLLLSARRFREIALSVLTAVVTTLFSLWVLDPDIVYSWHQTVRALTTYEQSYAAALKPIETGFDHSLFALCKVVLTPLLGAQGAQSRLGVYMLVVATGGILLYVFRIRHLPITNQVLCFSVAAILLPPVSYDYTLLHLYAGLVLVGFVAVDADRSGYAHRSIRGLWPAALLLAFLLSPETEAIHNAIRYGGQVKSLALLALGYVALRYPLSAGPADTSVQTA